MAAATKDLKNLRFRVQVKDGLLIPEKDVKLPQSGQYIVILQLESSDDEVEVDALAEIAAMAQPIGPPDLSVKLDHYTNRVLNDDTTS